MTAKTRQILDIIEDALLAGHNSNRNVSDLGLAARAIQDGNTATELWNILSALRGPDNEEQSAKIATIDVRQRAFPRLAEQARNTSQFTTARFGNRPMFDKSESMKGLEEVPALGGGHFEAHIIMAWDALREPFKR
jgi:hypothetical protein